MKYNILNLDCANCAKEVEEGLSKDERLNNVIVNFSTSKISFESDNKISLEEINRLVNNIEPDARITSLEDVKQLVRNSFEYSFLSDEMKEKFIAQL